jgi:hypothetical protein
MRIEEHAIWYRLRYLFILIQLLWCQGSISLRIVARMHFRYCQVRYLLLTPTHKHVILFVLIVYNIANWILSIKQVGNASKGLRRSHATNVLVKADEWSSPGFVWYVRNFGRRVTISYLRIISKVNTSEWHFALVPVISGRYEWRISIYFFLQYTFHLFMLIILIIICH